MFGLQIALCLTVLGAGLNTQAYRHTHSRLVSRPHIRSTPCSPQNPCGDGEGDCDNNDPRTCARGLFCGENNCYSQYGVGDNKDDCCTSVKSCDQTQIVTQTNRVTCCTKENPCGEREGDCTRDSDCAGNLVCGSNNCRKFHPFADQFDDCCERPTIKIHKPKPSIGACTAYSPCGEGEGDCHDDSTCAGSLVCGSNNCRQIHGSRTNAKFDCCVKRNLW